MRATASSSSNADAMQLALIEAVLRPSLRKAVAAAGSLGAAAIHVGGDGRAVVADVGWVEAGPVPLRPSGRGTTPRTMKRPTSIEMLLAPGVGSGTRGGWAADLGRTPNVFEFVASFFRRASDALSTLPSSVHNRDFPSWIAALRRIPRLSAAPLLPAAIETDAHRRDDDDVSSSHEVPEEIAAALRSPYLQPVLNAAFNLGFTRSTRAAVGTSADVVGMQRAPMTRLMAALVLICAPGCDLQLVVKVVRHTWDAVVAPLLRGRIEAAQQQHQQQRSSHQRICGAVWRSVVASLSLACQGWAPHGSLGAVANSLGDSEIPRTPASGLDTDSSTGARVVIDSAAGAALRTVVDMATFLVNDSPTTTASARATTGAAADDNDPRALVAKVADLAFPPPTSRIATRDSPTVVGLFSSTCDASTQRRRSRPSSAFAGRVPRPASACATAELALRGTYSDTAAAERTTHAHQGASGGAKALGGMRQRLQEHLRRQHATASGSREQRVSDVDGRTSLRPLFRAKALHREAATLRPGSLRTHRTTYSEMRSADADADATVIDDDAVARAAAARTAEPGNSAWFGVGRTARGNAAVPLARETGYVPSVVGSLSQWREYHEVLTVLQRPDLTDDERRRLARCHAEFGISVREPGREAPGSSPPAAM